MAGPTASILVQRQVSEEQAALMRNKIAEMSNHIEGDDFWIEERPFLLIMGPEYEDELAEYSEDGFEELLGWLPTDIVSIAAMCNDQIDHVLLGKLCLRLGKVLEGIIDFGGQLPTDGHKHQGLYAMPYTAAAGHECVSHVGTLKFLEWWIAQPNFGMVK